MYGQGMNFPNWFHGTGGFMHGPLGMVMIILFWGLVITLIVRLVQSTFPSKKPHEHKAELRAIDILNKRYASGEITKNEFLEIKKDIT